jgi:hypothetical protein
MNQPKIESDFLWSAEGEPEPDVARLEGLLSAYRLQAPAPPPPALRTPPPQRTTTDWRRGRILAAAAALVLACLAAFLGHRRERGWTVEALAGAPRIGGAELSGAGSLVPGQWLRTDAASSALLKVAGLGEVRIDPGTMLRIAASSGPQRRLDLRQGAIEARITAPPRLFIVDAPGARAVDMGCEYRLEMDPDGAGTLKVFLGWVYLEHNGLESRVPMNGGTCLIRPGRGPGTPFFDDAPAVFQSALASFDDGHGAALADVLHGARPRDALSLWHLLARTSGSDRAAVFDRLTALKGTPGDVKRDDILALNSAALDRLWDDLRPF